MDEHLSENRPRFRARLWRCLGEGALKALKQLAWLLAIMIPVSFVVTVLQWSGALAWAARPLGPVFKLVGLPAESCLAFVTGAALNVYSAIAALASVELTARQMTIFALASLFSHAFFLELTVQRKMGVPVWRMAGLRLAASVLGAAALNLLMPATEGDAHVVLQASTALPEGFGALMGVWFLSISRLCAKVVALVVSLMILQRVLNEFGVVEVLARLLAPLMWILGLPPRVAFLWIAANTLGLTYGAAIFVEEIESGKLVPRDAALLNRSVGLCHSLLEDTLLFVAVGAGVLWITLPRLLVAAAVVWLFRAWRRLRARAGSEETAPQGGS